MADNLLFMIEGEPALTMVRDYIAERLRVKDANAALIEPLRQGYGVERASTDRETGVVLAVVFPKKVHPDFTKPKGRHDLSYPKKNTEWAKLFAAQKGHPNQATLIANRFGVPLSLGYKSGDGEGWRCLGNMLAECGFLFMGKDGPYALWIPDVPAEVAAEEARGNTVEEPAKSFRPEFPGCRPMEPEEWDILVAQHKLAVKKAARGVALPVASTCRECGAVEPQEHKPECPTGQMDRTIDVGEVDHQTFRTPAADAEKDTP